MTDTRPPVPPVEGHYAMLRNADVMGPFEGGTHHCNSWQADGSYEITDCVGMDIIATIPPELIVAVADGRLQALMAICQPILDDVADPYFADQHDNHLGFVIDGADTQTSFADFCAIAKAITAMQGTPHEPKQ